MPSLADTNSLILRDISSTTAGALHCYRRNTTKTDNNTTQLACTVSRALTVSKDKFEDGAPIALPFKPAQKEDADCDYSSYCGYGCLTGCLIPIAAACICLVGYGGVVCYKKKSNNTTPPPRHRNWDEATTGFFEMEDLAARERRQRIENNESSHRPRIESAESAPPVVTQENLSETDRLSQEVTNPLMRPD